MKTLFVLLDKEIRQFFRNAFLPKLVIVFPVMVILIIPWVTTMDVRHIGVSVVDNDHSETSRRIIQKIEASDYFNLRGVTESYDDSFALLEGGEADVILTIPNDFELSLIGDSPKRIGIDVNGINAMKGGLGSQLWYSSSCRLSANYSKRNRSLYLPICLRCRIGIILLSIINIS